MKLALSLKESHCNDTAPHLFKQHLLLPNMGSFIRDSTNAIYVILNPFMQILSPVNTSLSCKIEVKSTHCNISCYTSQPYSLCNFGYKYSLLCFFIYFHLKTMSRQCWLISKNIITAASNAKSFAPRFNLIKPSTVLLNIFLPYILICL